MHGTFGTHGAFRTQGTFLDACRIECLRRMTLLRTPEEFMVDGVFRTYGAFR